MLIIGNGRLVTRDAGQPFFENGAVAIDGTTIKKVGTLEEIKKEFPEAEFVDAKGGVIMPAFINTHEHIYSAMARGLSIKGYDPHGFLDILDGLWWTIDRHLTNEQTRQSARVTFIDSMQILLANTKIMFDKADRKPISVPLFQSVANVLEIGRAHV